MVSLVAGAMGSRRGWVGSGAIGDALWWGSGVVVRVVARLAICGDRGGERASRVRERRTRSSAGLAACKADVTGESRS